MTSKDIYTSIPPTYLYIKQHSVTSLKYFGKTTKDPYTYNGSGKHWTRHIKKHGKEHIVTLWVSDLYHDTSIVEPALHFSKENNIVESTEWANQKHENGLDGGCTKLSDETKAKISKALKGKPRTGETKAKMSKPRSDEAKANMSAAKKGKPKSDEHKAKLSDSMKNKQPFFSIIVTRKCYHKITLSRYYPEFKQYF